MKKGEIKRKKIIIYYALAIVLPCLILGILAFRGIKNDQALAEREQRRSLTEASQQILRETNAYVTSIEKYFADIIESAPIPREKIFTDSILSSFSSQHQAVEGIFFLSGNSDLMLLKNEGMVYVPDDYLTVPDINGSQYSRNILDKGWQYEFREQDYPKALEYYQTILLNVNGKQSVGEILNTIARLQKKLKLDDEAIITYERIWNDCPEVFIQNKIPLGAVALLEKSLLCLGKKDTITALNTVFLLMSRMQRSAWKLDYSLYSGLLSKNEEIISACKSSVDKEARQLLKMVNVLKDSLSLSQKHTEYLLSFLGNSVTPIGDREPDLVETSRHKTQINGESYLYSLVYSNEYGQWGLIMDPDYILRNIIYGSIINKARESDFNWEVTDLNGNILLKSENMPEKTPPIYTVFPSNLPSLNLKLFLSDTGLFASLFSPGKSIFLYIFILIVVILACGLFFTLQAVNNELNLSRMKSSFMSTVSHEFKSPLTSIRQMTEMLVRDRVPSLERKQKYYSTILQQSERLSHLIDNILDFTKMEEGHKGFCFEKADIIPAVRDIVELFREVMANKGFQINLAIPEVLPHVVVDREAVEQVVYNLIDNACKYSGESKVIDIQLFQADRNIIISVRDYGIGIRKEDQEKIFSRFYRAGEELTQSVKGSGIGLAIVKQIVDAHKGEITVDSTPGNGSIFSVKLPLNQNKRQ